MRILFANPDQKLSQIYVQHMQDHFLVDSAHDGLTAIRKFKLAPPSLIVSDYYLPLLSGLSFLKFVRNHELYAGTPFVFLSDFDDNTQALNFGANDWLNIKTCHPDHLLSNIYHHLKTNKYGIYLT